MARTDTVESAARVLDVLALLFRADFVAGVTPGDIQRELTLSPSAVSRYLATLEDRGCVERIPETGRFRPAVRWAQYAAHVQRSVDDARRRIDELHARIQIPQH